MSKKDNILSTTGVLGGLATSGASGYFGTLSADTFSEQVSSGAGIGDFAADFGEASETMSDAADGNYFALTTVLGLLSLVSGSSSGAPDAVIEVFTRNAKPYSVVEQKAKKVYDKYDHNHVISKDEGASLVITDTDAAALVRDILSNVKSKEELMMILTTLEMILKQNLTEPQKEEVYSRVLKKNEEEKPC